MGTPSFNIPLDPPDLSHFAREKVATLLSTVERWRSEPVSLLTMLIEIQEIWGSLPERVLESISFALKIPRVDLFAILEFYDLLHSAPPGPRLSLCVNTACAVRGGGRVGELLSRVLAKRSDMGLYLEEVPCQGCCDLAPVAVFEGLPRRLTPSGRCRLCVVEVEGWGRLLPACVTPVEEGMRVFTGSERVERARRVILELHWAEDPEEAPRGDVLGRCELTDLVEKHGIERVGTPSGLRPNRIDDRHPLIGIDLRKCIGCGRCEQACREVAVCDVLAVVGRGAKAHVATAFDLPMKEAGCVACGACVSSCPTGALFDLRSPRVPEAEVRVTRTICPYCGVGCAMKVYTHRDRIVLVEGSDDGPANRGSLCVKGRYGFEYATHPDRLTIPLIRREGVPRIPPKGVDPRSLFQEASWEEALGLVASKLKALLTKYGPNALGVLGSAKGTNEDNSILQRFARAALRTSHIDHCARLCHSSSVSAMTMAFGHGAMTNAPQEIPEADAIFILGHNTSENHPVIGGAVKRAVRKGARLIVLDPRRTELSTLADVHLRPRGGTDVAVLNGLAHVILEEGLLNEPFIRERTEGFEELKALVAEYTPERVEALSGVPAEDLRRAARLYATAKAAMMFHGMGMTQHTTGTENVLAICNLAMLTGQIGRPGTGVNPLRGQNNVQGACDMGVLPHFLPGYRLVTDEAARRELEERWGCSLPREPGLTVVEMIDAAS